MAPEEKEELLYILESRLTKYIAAAKDWLVTTGPKIKGKTFTDRINGDIPLYFKSNAKPWQSIIKNISPFCFCFTKDLGISNMLSGDLRISDALEILSGEGLSIQGLHIVVKSNTHLLGTSQQVIIMYPEELETETVKEITITMSVADAISILDNETVSRSIRTKITKQLQGKKEFDT